MLAVDAEPLPAGGQDRNVRAGADQRLDDAGRCPGRARSCRRRREPPVVQRRDQAVLDWALPQILNPECISDGVRLAPSSRTAARPTHSTPPEKVSP